MSFSEIIMSVNVSGSCLCFVGSN